VDPTYDLQYSGSVIDLVNFNGHVLLESNTFTGNVVKYQTCDVAARMDANDMSTHTDRYTNFGTKSKLQIRSVISVVGH
jgi:hypothetical protein